MAKDDVVRLVLRLHKDTHEMLKLLAEHNGRSLNSEITWCINLAIQANRQVLNKKRRAKAAT